MCLHESEDYPMPRTNVFHIFVPNPEHQFTTKQAPLKDLLNGTPMQTFWKLAAFFPDLALPVASSPSGDWDKGCFQNT